MFGSLEIDYLAKANRLKKVDMDHVVSVSMIGLSTVAGYFTFSTIHN